MNKLIRVSFMALYVTLAALWLLKGFRDDMLPGIVAFFLLIRIIEAAFDVWSFEQVRKSLYWFATHVRLDPKSIPSDVPEELKNKVLDSNEK